MDDRDTDGDLAACSQPEGHDWQLIRADRVPHEYWPPCAEFIYRCRHCQTLRQFRRPLRR